MASIEQHYAGLVNMDEDRVSKVLFDFINSIKDELIDLNKKQLHENSKDIFGNPLGFYSRATEIITRGEKKWGEPFDAKDTGSFLDKFYMAISGDTFYFGSTDPKTKDILQSDDWLSHDLFGLTDKDLQMVIDDKFRPFIIQHYRKLLGL